MPRKTTEINPFPTAGLAQQWALVHGCGPCTVLVRFTTAFAYTLPVNCTWKDLSTPRLIFRYQEAKHGTKS
jgi:hypothetical protein